MLPEAATRLRVRLVPKRLSEAGGHTATETRARVECASEISTDSPTTTTTTHPHHLVPPFQLPSVHLRSEVTSRKNGWCHRSRCGRKLHLSFSIPLGFLAVDRYGIHRASGYGIRHERSNQQRHHRGDDRTTTMGVLWWDLWRFLRPQMMFKICDLKAYGGQKDNASDMRTDTLAWKMPDQRPLPATAMPDDFNFRTTA